jgi:hypothetical protein
MVISQKKTGTEVISFNDVVHAGAQAVPVARQGMQMAGQPGAADLERLEKYIVLADKGISLLGRAEAIIGPIIAKRAAPAEPAPVRYGADDGSRVNKEAPQERAQEPHNEPVAASQPAAGINPLDIAGALRMIDGQAPGITAVQIADLIEKNPDAVGRLMSAALSKKGGA